MKRGAPDHWKMSDLARRLGIPDKYGVTWANGALERLWHFSSQYTPRGDIGKVPDEAIARACLWPEDEAAGLISALVGSRWLDQSEEFRLTVHDWTSHCDDGVHSKVARLKSHFVDGNPPKITGLRSREKIEIEAFYNASLQPVATRCNPSATPLQPVATPVQPRCNALATATATATAIKTSPPTPSEKDLEEVSAAFDRHQCFHNREPKDLVIQKVLSMNGDFNWDRFRANHQPYCSFWDEKGWNFSKVTFIGWINAGMPGSPPNAGRGVADSANVRSNLPTARELMDRDRKRDKELNGKD